MAGAVTTITLPNGNPGTEVLDAFAINFNRPETVVINELTVPNPETKEEFFKRQIIIWIKGQVNGHKEREASKAVREAPDTLNIT